LIIGEVVRTRRETGRIDSAVGVMAEALVRRPRRGENAEQAADRPRHLETAALGEEGEREMRNQQDRESDRSAAVYLATFGSRGYTGGRNRLCESARRSGWFQDCFGFGPLNLGAAFLARNAYWIRTHGRGFGYWIWKPQAIRRAMARLAAGDILVWMDAGCYLNPAGRDRFRHYCRLVTEHPSGILAFALPFPERFWTKADVFDALKAPPETADSRQLMATCFLLRKDETSETLVQRWSQVMRNRSLIDDSPSVRPNASDFRENRHDQSVFSLLCKEMGALIMDDETWWDPDWEVRGRNYPFWGIRDSKGTYMPAGGQLGAG